MQRVYVQNKDGEPLMPTERCGSVRRWLKQGKASVAHLCPFTIRLKFETGSKIQEIQVGLDTGAVNVGCSAVCNDKVLYASETKLRTDIHKKMLRRAMYRRSRRSRKLRYRQPRFNNRTRPDGWLPPSLRSKLQSTVRVVTDLAMTLPIAKVRVEIAKFDIQKLQNPNIQGEEYQHGVTEGYDNVRAYVFERDKYTCQICKKRDGILQTHHIIHRKDGGSDCPDNLATVHKICHDKFHAGRIKHNFRKPKQYQQAVQVTILKDYIVRELRTRFDVEITFGYISKRNRMLLSLPKSHAFDAVAICQPRKVERITHIFKRVCVTQRRYQLSKGVRSEKKLPAGKIFGFLQWDKVKICNRVGFVKGRRNSGFFDICDISGESISHSIKYTKIQRLCSNSIMEDIDSPPTNEIASIRSKEVL